MAGGAIILTYAGGQPYNDLLCRAIGTTPSPTARSSVGICEFRQITQTTYTAAAGILCVGVPGSPMGAGGNRVESKPAPFNASGIMQSRFTTQGYAMLYHTSAALRRTNCHTNWVIEPAIFSVPANYHIVFQEG
ncbi:hypothetical protein PAAG_12406 [Paracoccidioides lutzii Pb01]|uniref:Uncharacterized protein n=1 Tax=Paracoccidioides lutzii (strain ATCC MYA-826 / Pb01) TaxID=502779 RepID=A0A0A2V448_PARBA|nr:hypothetical protein PAAG_12406 [Paracoccidioides lutzii Pb01]KGQ00935.1 hypothetical protein PAAG_12406 [Paracoccidioides lutzii Pb01]